MFEIYRSNVTGRKGVGKGISINKTQITLGKEKPPFEYAQIEYDKENVLLRLSAGTIDTAPKVMYRKGSYFINAYKFIREGFLPLGRYSRGDTKETQWTFHKEQS